MKVYVTSIGEPTTELCIWSLERHGHKVTLLQSDSSLADKLEEIYQTVNDDFLRVDADVIVNKNINRIRAWEFSTVWWWCLQTFDWYKQDVTSGGIQYISRKALPFLRNNISFHKAAERPESEMYRLKEFHGPRRCYVYDKAIMGLHGWCQDDLDRVRRVKAKRGQLDNYDFELVERMNNLSN